MTLFLASLDAEIGRLEQEAGRLDDARARCGVLLSEARQLRGLYATVARTDALAAAFWGPEGEPADPPALAVVPDPAPPEAPPEPVTHPASPDPAPEPALSRPARRSCEVCGKPIWLKSKGGRCFEHSPQGGPKWTPAQDCELVELCGKGWSTKRIADRFDRSRDAVRARVKFLRAQGVEVPERTSGTPRKVRPAETARPVSEPAEQAERALPEPAAELPIQAPAPAGGAFPEVCQSEPRRGLEPLTTDSCHPAGLSRPAESFHVGSSTWPGEGPPVENLPSLGPQLVEGAAPAPDAAPTFSRPEPTAVELAWEPLTFDNCPPAGLPNSAPVAQSESPASPEDGLSIVVLPDCEAELDQGIAPTAVADGPGAVPDLPQSQRQSVHGPHTPAGPVAALLPDSPRPVEPEKPAPSKAPATSPAVSPRAKMGLAPAPRPVAIITEAIRELRGADRPVMGAAADFHRPAPSRSGLADMRRAVERNLDALGHRAPWTPQRDLALVEAVLRHGNIAAGARAAKVIEAEARARFAALAAPIKHPRKGLDVNGQEVLVAELRRRAALAGEVAA